MTPGPWPPTALLIVGAMLATLGVRSQRTLDLRAPLQDAVPPSVDGLRARDLQLSDAEVEAAGVTSKGVRRVHQYRAPGRRYDLTDCSLPRTGRFSTGRRTSQALIKKKRSSPAGSRTRGAKRPASAPLLRKLDEAVRGVSPEADAPQLARQIVDAVCSLGMSGARLWHLVEGQPSVWHEAGKLPPADSARFDAAVSTGSLAALPKNEWSALLSGNGRPVGYLETCAERPLDEETRRALEHRAATIRERSSPMHLPRPAYATGMLNLNIPPLEHTLSLQVTPAEKELEPGGETTIDVLLKDANGKPVSGAELAVVVVDEAVLALSNYQLANPVGTFYSSRPADVSSQYSRASIVLVDPLALASEAKLQREVAATNIVEEVAMEAPAAAMPTITPSAGGGVPNEASSQVPIRVRIDFNPLATFAPSVPTDANGEAHISVKLPDNLTRYPVMVVAVDAGGRQFGMGETNLTARLTLMAIRLRIFPLPGSAARDTAAQPHAQA